MPLLAVDNLTVSFGRGSREVRAVEGVTLSVMEGDIYGVVGETGCGKSTLASALLDIVASPGRVTGGEVRIKGRSLASMSVKERDRMRGAEIGMVFQSSMNAFNPVITIGAQVRHILKAHPDVFPDQHEGIAYFEHLCTLMRLDYALIWKSFESQLSGGMKQRVAIAISALLKPQILVLDEVTTALDVWNQRLVMAILRDLHRRLGVTIIFVTHDLAVVAELASRVAVMYAARLVESATVQEIFAVGRRHPYVAALVGAIPSILEDGRSVQPIPGQVPSLADLPRGCRFASRCTLVEEVCLSEEPPLLANSSGHLVACHVVNAGLEVETL